MNKFALSVFVFALMLTSALAGPVASPAPLPVKAKVGDNHGKSQLPFETISYARKEEAYIVSIKYPKFSGLSDKLASQLNDRIREFVWSEMNKHLLGTKNFGPPPGKRDKWMDKYKITYQYNCDYTIAFATPKLVSIDFHFYTFTGGLHGNPYDLAFNYRLSPFKQISFENIFSNCEELDAISDLSQIDLCRSLKSSSVDWVLKGTRPLKDNFSVFTFDANGITFIFQPYQVAPYCDGMPSVTLTWSQVKPLMPKFSPLKSMAQNARSDQRVTDAIWRTQEKLTAFKTLQKRTTN